MKPADMKKLVAYVEKHGQRAASRYFKVPRTTLQGWLETHQKDMEFQAVKAQPPVVINTPKRDTKRFIFSSAQANTKLDDNFLDNLEAYADHVGAAIHIAGFTYGERTKSDDKFPERIQKYLTNRKFDIAGKLWFCGEMNTLPTAVRPLEGFETYTRSQWGIFPHPRISLKSIATPFKAQPKIIMTTGAVTKPNYIQKRAGIKAEFHHVIAAVLVEIDRNGDFFCRHLVAEKDGSFQDLTNYVSNGKVRQGVPVEAITWGDIHCEMLDRAVARGAWGIDSETLNDTYRDDELSMLDALRPKVQFFHDSLDFRRRNHHSIDDPHEMFKAWWEGKECVKGELFRVGKFLAYTSRAWCESYVVDSNHDRALAKWLKRADYKRDPVNAVFFLECQSAVYRALAAGDENFVLAEWAVKNASPECALDRVKWLHKTDSYLICKHAGGGIECALHGDEGANGAKGALNSFSRMGPKAIVAHTHHAAIHEGIYQVGTSSKIDMGYNAGGLSSWNHTHCVTYPSGKRTLVTMQGQKFCAL